MKWLTGLFGSRKKQPSNSDVDHPMAVAEAVIAKTNGQVKELDSMASELSPEELVWMEWFNGLPEIHKKVVEYCGESGVKVTPENFGEILESLSDQWNK